MKFPEFINDKKAKKLIEQLLSHNPEQRHGGSFACLKSHPWFEEFSWNDLLMKNDKKLEPPYIPEVSLRNIKELAANSTGKFLDCLKEVEMQPDYGSMSDRSRDSFEWGSFGEVIEIEDQTM